MRFLQERIRQVQQGFEEWEDKTRREMEQCARYLDSLSSDDVIKYDPNWLRESIKTPTHDKPWEQVGYHLTIEMLLICLSKFHCTFIKIIVSFVCALCTCSCRPVCSCYIVCR